MNPQVILEDSEEHPFIINMCDVDPDLPVYGHIVHAIMDDDSLPQIEIYVDGELISTEDLHLTDKQIVKYKNIMFERFGKIVEQSLEKILDGDITEEAINEYNSLTEEELEERCQQSRNR